MKTPQNILDLFIEGVTRAGDIKKVCHSYHAGKKSLWTTFATSGLIYMCKMLNPNWIVASRGNADLYGQSEYMGLDLCAMNDTWSAPVLVAEHENVVVPQDRIEYSTWKLLSVDAKQRILVAYYGVGEVGSFDDLCGVVRKVAKAQPQKGVVLIGGNYNAVPTDENGLRDAFRTISIGP